MLTLKTRLCNLVEISRVWYKDHDFSRWPFYLKLNGVKPHLRGCPSNAVDWPQPHRRFPEPRGAEWRLAIFKMLSFEWISRRRFPEPRGADKKLHVSSIFDPDSAHFILEISP